MVAYTTPTGTLSPETSNTTTISAPNPTLSAPLTPKPTNVPTITNAPASTTKKESLGGESTVVQSSTKGTELTTAETTRSVFMPEVIDDPKTINSTVVETPRFGHEGTGTKGISGSHRGADKITSGKKLSKNVSQDTIYGSSENRNPSDSTATTTSASQEPTPSERVIKRDRIGTSEKNTPQSQVGQKNTADSKKGTHGPKVDTGGHVRNSISSMFVSIKRLFWK